MTISSGTVRNTYTGNGSATSFPYTFKVFASSEVQVYLAGVLQASGYTVSDVGNPAGGNVVFAGAPGNGISVILLSLTPRTQALDLVENDPMPAGPLEDAYDKLTKMQIEQDETLARTLRFPPESPNANVYLPTPVTDQFLAWGAGPTVVNKVFQSSGTLATPVGIADGGTSASTVSGARAALSTQAAITAAATLPVTAEGYQVVSGNTGITALATQPPGVEIILRFTGTPLLTHNATNLILIGAVTYQVAAGDVLDVISDGSGNWREVWRKPVTSALADRAYGGDGTWRLFPRPEAGRLVFSSGTSLRFNPFKGTLLPVKTSGAWQLRDIGAGVASGNPTSAANFVNGTGSQTLAANTAYLVTVFDNAGVLTFDFLTSLAHAADATTGVEIKSGDDTRTVVGLIRTNATPNFVDSLTQRFCISWFNRRRINGLTTLAADRSTASTTFVELNTADRVEFVTWADEAVHASIGGNATNSGTGYSMTAVGFDAAVEATIQGMTAHDVAADRTMGGCAGWKSLADGYHHADFFGKVSAGTGTWRAGDAGGTVACRLHVGVRG